MSGTFRMFVHSPGLILNLRATIQSKKWPELLLEVAKTDLFDCPLVRAISDERIEKL